MGFQATEYNLHRLKLQNDVKQYLAEIASLKSRVFALEQANVELQLEKNVLVFNFELLNENLKLAKSELSKACAALSVARGDVPKIDER